MNFKALPVSFIICITPIFGADVVLPKEVVVVLEKSAKAEAEVKAEYDSKMVKIRMELTAKLIKQQENATKAGNLELALNLKARIEAIIIPELPKTKPISTSKDVVLFPLPGFKGQGVTVKEYNIVIDAYKVGFPNDSLRSVKLPAGYTLEVYQGNIGGDGTYIIESESDDLSNTPALGMTSFMIKRPVGK